MSLDAAVLIHGLWEVREEIEPEPDRIRREYVARNMVTGEERELDVSSNGRCNHEVIRAIIDLGFPTRHTLRQSGPLDAEDIIKLLRARLQFAEAA